MIRRRSQFSWSASCHLSRLFVRTVTRGSARDEPRTDDAIMSRLGDRRNVQFSTDPLEMATDSSETERALNRPTDEWARVARSTTVARCCRKRNSHSPISNDDWDFPVVWAASSSFSERRTLTSRSDVAVGATATTTVESKFRDSLSQLFTVRL